MYLDVKPIAYDDHRRTLVVSSDMIPERVTVQSVQRMSYGPDLPVERRYVLAPNGTTFAKLKVGGALACHDENTFWVCNNCHESFLIARSSPPRDVWIDRNPPNFCPSCGAISGGGVES